MSLLTRNGLDWTAKYPQIARAVASLRFRGVGKLGFDLEDFKATRQDKFVNKEFEKRAPMLIVYAGTKASRERIAMSRRVMAEPNVGEYSDMTGFDTT